MFKVLKKEDRIELTNHDQTSKAVIALNDEGGRLVFLSHNDKNIVADLEGKPYKYSQAGSILFPFANRINEGKYDFNGHKYQLECNEPGADNAIHGFVFNKIFKLESFLEEEQKAVVKLAYTEQQPPSGYPFQYHIQFVYTLDATALTLEIIVKNIGDKSLPYNLGWHPYFCVNDLDKSFLSFNSGKQVVFNEKMITTDIKEVPIPNPYALKGKALDDCFVLEQQDVKFQADNYKITIKGEPNSTYLQIYAPPGEQRIAIEPMTGISDSFNYKVGLHVLEPNETAKETWTIGFEN